MYHFYNTASWRYAKVVNPKATILPLERAFLNPQWKKNPKIFTPISFTEKQTIQTNILQSTYIEQINYLQTIVIKNNVQVLLSSVAKRAMVVVVRTPGPRCDLKASDLSLRSIISLCP